MNKFNKSEHELTELMESSGMTRILKNEYKELIDVHTFINFTFKEYVISRLIGNYSFDSCKHKLDYIK